ncbi:MAG: outer membrane protein assembly factor BamA, partial [Gallionellaceae bacterium]|nr:outer membrane protein assembly factor BamA [Gallionellaceae bacterium]
RLETEQGVLIVLLRERPTIANVYINGIKDFPQEQMQSNLKLVGLAEGRIFDRSALDKAEQELKRQYVARGKYSVTVKTRVDDLERNRVSVNFDVVEGEVAKIRQINIVGNQVFQESELRKLMELSTPKWPSWFRSSDQYSKPKLSADLENLRSYYLDAGYLEFMLDSTQVSITPDKRDIFIGINLTEGAQYTVSDVKLNAAPNVAGQDEMRKLITLQPGAVFSRKALTESTKQIGDYLGDDGYAFANVNAVPELDKEKHQAAFNFMVDPGPRVYVRNIEISGNTKTRDEVIRREFRQMEGAWFATSKIKKSKQRVDRLDFFSEVDIETLPVPNTTDQLDLKLAVKEKPTGDFSIGAGVSSGEGLVLTSAITQRNLFGSGKSLSAQVNTSKVNEVYSLSYTNPYYTDDGVSRGFDVYKRRVNSSRTAVSQYSSTTLGAGVRYGVPLSDDENIHYGMSAENTELTLTDASPQRFRDYVDTFGTSTTNLMGTIGWTHDSRDSAIFTTSGTVQSAFVEVALPVSDQRFYKLTYQHQWFHPVTQNVILWLNGEAGSGHGYGGKPLPFFKNYYAGGPGSVRGYEASSLGPRDSTNNALGGTKRVVGNAELLLPMPGLSDEKSVRVSLFVDGGAVYGDGSLAGTSGMRYSAGMAFTWVSPIGPLKISYGVPLNSQPGDKTQRTQFTLGSIF